MGDDVVAEERDQQPRQRCAGCWWYREFPWYVQRREGYCAHPLVKKDPDMRLYTDGQAPACERYAPLVASAHVDVEPR